MNFRAALLALTLIVFPLLAPRAQACMCAGYEVPTCALYWRAHYVFVAQVKSISAKPDRHGVDPENTKARLQLQEVFRGDLTGEVLDGRGGGADCGLEYERGKSYLIYADDYDPATKMIRTSTCAGSREMADDDENYLASIRALGEPKAESTVLGQLLRYEDDKPLSGIQVWLHSNGRSDHTRTDEQGNYSFTLNQGGTFRASAKLPFAAFDGGDGGIKEVSTERTGTVLEYEDVLPLGQCHYKQFSIVELPEKSSFSDLKW
jgi:hypothetical protein